MNICRKGIYPSNCLQINMEASPKYQYNVTNVATPQLYLPHPDRFLVSRIYLASTRVNILSTKILRPTSVII